VTLFLPPENNDVDGYCRAIKQLSKFGRAGLPFLTAQLRGLSPDIEKLGYQRKTLLYAHAEALAEIALTDDDGLTLLLNLPTSRLAIVVGKNDPGWQISLRRKVAKQLEGVGRGKPGAVKSIMPYFIAMLRLPEEEDRLIGANALATFGADAEKALPILKKMTLDPSKRVRDAVKEAIAAIERKEE
jgi:hypothetical protein